MLKVALATSGTHLQQYIMITPADLSIKIILVIITAITLEATPMEMELELIHTMARI